MMTVLVLNVTDDECMTMDPGHDMTTMSRISVFRHYRYQHCNLINSINERHQHYIPMLSETNTVILHLPPFLS